MHIARLVDLDGGKIEDRRYGVKGCDIDEFHQHGVLAVDFDFDHALLDSIVQGVQPHYDQRGLAQRLNGTRIQDGWKLVEAVRMLAVDWRVLAVLQQLFARKPLAFQTLNFPFGTQQCAHSDTVHFSSRPEGFMAGVWVALEDVDEGNGPLVYYPGSHRLPYFSMQDLGLQAGREYYEAYENQIASLIDEEGLQGELSILKKGQAVIWHANLLHGGSEQHNPDRTRHSQVTHYYFEGCRYYTPMLSTNECIRWRNPRWIPGS